MSGLCVKILLFSKALQKYISDTYTDKLFATFFV